jgi:protein gp37
MGYPTPIEWTDATWNPVGGCSIASPGCGPCYAQQLAGTRLQNHPLYRGTTTLSPRASGLEGGASAREEKLRPIFNGTMTAAPARAGVWSWPLTWRGAREPKLGAGMPSLIFVGDMSDVFHQARDRNTIEKVLSIGISSRHILQLLTKRPERMRDLFETLPQRQRDFDCDSALDFKTLPFANFWLGASAERQKEFDERWPHLRRLAELGFVVFISYEPAMGPLALPADFLALRDRAWLIAGGCSGDRAWPAHPDWFRRVRDQCAAAGVPFFFKQWGEFAPTRTRSEASLLGGHTPVVWVEGMAGCVALDRVSPCVGSSIEVIKALTIWQPWASLIMIGAKPFEFRGWNFALREPALVNQTIVVHAGARPVKPDEVDDLLRRLGGDDDMTGLIVDKALELLTRVRASYKCRLLPLAAGLGTARLGRPRNAGAIFGGQKGVNARLGQTVADSDRGAFNFAWPLTDIKPFAAPIPMRGAQGFWQWPGRIAA